jgi:TolB-like protein
MTDAPTEREGEGALTKLRRRKVVQWGIAYLAGAWALLQGIEYITNTFHWPEQFQQLSTLALLIGLPIAVVIAWYHGDRGEQRVSGAELTIIVLLLLLAGGFLWHYQQPGEKPAAPGSVAGPAPAATPPPAAPAVADTRPSIAVLPFENRSRLEDDIFFVDGIHDDILTQLSKVSALKVISRTSVEQFRDTKLPTKAIAGQLGVKSILEGGVQRAGDRVRINVQLIDAGTDAHLWAESYDRELTAANIFAIQSEVAAAIAGALKATLTADEKVRMNAVPTRSMEAWEAYQLGRQRMAKRTSAALEDAERLLRRTIELDPAFAPAHAALANTLALQTDYSGRWRDTALAEATAAADRALELDPNLAEAWAAKAFAMRQEGGTREQALRRAIALNPNYAPAYHWLSMTLLTFAGKSQEGLEYAQRAAQLDPLSAVIRVWLGTAYSFAGRFDDAEAQYRRALEIDPLFPLAHVDLGLLQAWVLNRYAEAVPNVKRAIALDPGNPEYPAYLASLYLELGDESAARRVLAGSLARWTASPFSSGWAAFVYSSMGDGAAAERHARRAFDDQPRSWFTIEMLRNADLRRTDYAAARARYEKGYPELFEPAPKVDTANYNAAIGLALVLQKAREQERAQALLDRAEQAIRTVPRLGENGCRYADVEIHALRGDKKRALAALREAEKAGWRASWRYARDVDPNLDSIRDEPEFKAVFADIERDMARQRAELAARPKDAKLELDLSR